jgi:hypothetical protein
MASTVFPAPAASGGGPSAFTATAANVMTVYEHDQDFAAGVYTITVVPSSTEAKVTFLSNTALITSQSTSSGSAQFVLSTAATKVFILTEPDGDLNAKITIELTATELISDDIGNGTLDTINTTGTYNQTGLLGVLVLGGGEGGLRSDNPAENRGGSGGRAGFINGDVVFTNTATTVTVGAKGIAQTANTNLVAPTNSSFGNLVTANAASNFYANGNGGQGANGSGYSGQSGNASTVFKSWNGNSTTGGGGGGNGAGNSSGGSSVGSGIGTGGIKGSGSSAPTAATGKAAGGAGGRGPANNGGFALAANIPGDGTDGVVYVMRGF